MLQKFKITSCAFILVLFGFSLMTVSSVLAAPPGEAFTNCEEMPEFEPYGNYESQNVVARAKLDCFRDLAGSLLDEVYAGEEANDALQRSLSDDGEGGAGDPETRPSRVDVVRDYCGDDQWCVRETLYFTHLHERIEGEGTESLEVIYAADPDAHLHPNFQVSDEPLLLLFRFVRGLEHISNLLGEEIFNERLPEDEWFRVGPRAAEFNLRLDIDCPPASSIECE